MPDAQEVVDEGDHPGVRAAAARNRPLREGRCQIIWGLENHWRPGLLQGQLFLSPEQPRRTYT